jgi:FeS assembly protein IscX
MGHPLSWESLDWDDADAIAAILRDRFPGTDPDSVSVLEIARWTREIPLVTGEPAKGAEFQRQVEAIREAWRDAVR